MTQYSIPDGETEQIVRNGERGARYLVTVESGTARLEKDERYVRRGLRVPEDQQAVITLEEKNEDLYGFGDGETAELEVRRLGFNVSIFGREIIRVENSPQQTELVGNTARVSAEGVVEVNADQTGSISSTQTTTITADTDEVWEIRGFLFSWTPTNSTWDGNAEDVVEVTVSTEAEGIELGFARWENVDSIGTGEDDTLLYNSGGWGKEGDQNTVLAESRDDVRNSHRIDDTNGVNVVFDPSSQAVDATRKIRFVFDVIKA